jgi:hypothetical protein
VVVRDFDVVGIAATPMKADSILFVDPNAMLSRSIAPQAL